jgi:hypothetical protein
MASQRTSRRSRLALAISVAAVATSLAAGTVMAGEITGTGKSLKVDGGGKWGTGLHSRSLCAYSGQEDDQYLNHDGTPKAEPTKGDPGHAQSWGQIPHDARATLPDFLHPGMACNPNIGLEE